MAYSPLPSSTFIGGKIKYFIGDVPAGNEAVRLKASGSTPAGPAASAAYAGASLQLLPPQNGQASYATETSLSVVASSVRNASAYQLFQSATENGTYAAVGPQVSTPTLLVEGLALNTTYWFRWQTIGGSGGYLSSGQGAAFSGSTQPVAGAVVPPDFTALPKLSLTFDEGQVNADTKINGTLKIENVTGTSYPAEQLYDGAVTVKIRGNSTADTPKKPYSVGTITGAGASNKVPLFGLGVENDWALLADYFDEPGLSNYTMLNLPYTWSNKTEWSPRAVLVEVYVNGDYRGVYCFTEKIKQAATRVNIDKLGTAAADQTLPNLDGGYLWQQVLAVQADPGEFLYTTSLYGQQGETGEAGPYTNGFYPRYQTGFTLESPKYDAATPVQKDYSQALLQRLEDATYYLPFNDANGYRTQLDLPSAVDYYLQQEFSKQADAGIASIYFYKKRGNPKIFFGPGWDFDRSWGSGVNQLLDPSGFYMRNTHVWFRKWFQDPVFVDAVITRYQEIKAALTTAINKFQANAEALVSTGAAVRNITKWYAPADSVAAEQRFRTGMNDRLAYMRARKTWMDVTFVPGATLQDPTFPAEQLYDGSGVVELQDNDPHIKPVGSWVTTSGSGEQNGSYNRVLYTTTPGDYLKIQMLPGRTRLRLRGSVGPTGAGIKIVRPATGEVLATGTCYYGGGGFGVADYLTSIPDGILSGLVPGETLHYVMVAGGGANGSDGSAYFDRMQQQP